MASLGYKELTDATIRGVTTLEGKFRAGGKGNLVDASSVVGGAVAVSATPPYTVPTDGSDYVVALSNPSATGRFAIGYPTKPGRRILMFLNENLATSGVHVEVYTSVDTAGTVAQRRSMVGMLTLSGQTAPNSFLALEGHRGFQLTGLGSGPNRHLRGSWFEFIDNGVLWVVRGMTSSGNSSTAFTRYT